MKKLFLTLSIVMLFNSTSWCGFLISHTPAFEGYVKDAQAGQPIENVIVKLQWFRSPLISDGPGALEVGKLNFAVTNKEGHYFIPSHTFFTPFGLQGCKVQIHHWAYFPDGLETIYKSAYREFRSKYLEGGKILYNSNLTSLEHKYSAEGLPKGEMLSLDYYYFSEAKSLGIPDQSEMAVMKWESWSKKFPEQKGVFEWARNELQLINGRK